MLSSCSPLRIGATFRALARNFGLLLLLGAVPTWGQVGIPETPVGHAFSEFLAALNSGDHQRMAEYCRNYHDHPDEMLAWMTESRQKTGGLELLAVRSSEPLYLSAFVKERGSEKKATATLEIDPNEPHHLKTSWFRYIPPGVSMADYMIDGATRQRVIQGAIANLDEFYVFPDVAKRMAAALRAHQKQGDYNSIADGDGFARKLTLDLRAISHDKHLGVDFSPSLLPADLSKPDPDAVARNRKGAEQANCFFQKVEILPHNIGYLKFNAFLDPEMCGATATAAMNFLRNVDALIVDLRDNHGGRPEMVAFVSTYLFAEPTHLNDLWTRKGDTTQQFWTLPYVPGKRLVEQPVFVLTSGGTFSGGEEFTYDLKVLKRATIVGETTGGGAHPVSGHTVEGHFAVLVPFARAINPISKTNWEGVGVEPDVKVPASDALATAEKLAAEKVSAK
jgi:hypothetical protein